MKKMNDYYTSDNYEDGIIIKRGEHVNIDLSSLSDYQKEYEEEFKKENDRNSEKYRKIFDKLQFVKDNIDLELFDRICLFLKYYMSDYWETYEFKKDDWFEERLQKIRHDGTFDCFWMKPIDTEIVVYQSKKQQVPEEMSYMGNVFIQNKKSANFSCPFRLINPKVFETGFFPNYEAANLTADLMIKYNLSAIQTLVLIYNSDLYNIIYASSKINSHYVGCENESYYIGNIVDKYLSNLQLLISNEVRNFTAYGFLKLIDNFIFHIDAKQLLDKYPNIMPIIIVKLAIKNNVNNISELEKWLAFLNGFDNNLQDLIIKASADLEENTDIFPSLDEEQEIEYKYKYGEYDSNKDYGYIQRKTLIKNQLFFDIYRKFFNEQLAVERLQNLSNNDNFESLLNEIIRFKGEILKYVPSYHDTRKIIETYGEFIGGSIGQDHNGNWVSDAGLHEILLIKTQLKGREDYAKPIIDKEQKLFLAILDKYTKNSPLDVNEDNSIESLEEINSENTEMYVRKLVKKHIF